MNERFFVITNRAAHDGFVTSEDMGNVRSNQNPHGWTYQDLEGSLYGIIEAGGALLLPARPEREEVGDLRWRHDEGFTKYDTDRSAVTMRHT